ncbi:MAG: response regulator transcription factor [Alphaproteobacteria bacterium]|nr:response regulator transcription factor [Alphaproteobacteria bacterium]MDE2337496.1 response regulator transcription factor [Alphaproteobacteria bacterium]
MSETQIKPKILIIEDNPYNAKLLRIYLEEDGFDVMHAEDGHAGIEIMANTPRGISAILLDRVMPDMDGLETLRVLKLAPRAWNVPVIMLTAAITPRQAEEALLIGAHACLPKPYNREEILATLNGLLKRKR